MDAFATLWESTYRFLTRFSAHNTAPKSRQRHFMEEVTELLQASGTLEFFQTSHFAEPDEGRVRDNLLEEAADVIVTTQNICMAHGIRFEELEDAMRRVAQKNDAKTRETHQVVGGKITRKLTPPE